MIYKVFYQSNFDQAPVREETESLYLEAESERDARKKLADRDINIEYVTALTGSVLEYEQKQEDFKLENL
ncbi:DNA-dependent RNA polymerase subunit epsilon [Texcoconibacillus texcoconensis]|uniref:DNA-directed RNA polymerase subunit epsilon n=1 Tax=Texcoconibacillus texcoconensis TaxID=1095777 RepID=A0A840QLL5_9BACI|nr:DNA-directed RNA polymerase subunit epsilon [Texcoconibacillus texcoconensis]MBB5172246.1 DNA-dependent RNA polymerase auxiliary subunit epsilon [Texcoconibacillus texcoconensis]